MENWTLVSCGSGLDLYHVGGGYGCRYAGVDVSLDWVMAAQRSLKRLLTLLIVGFLILDCLVYCVLSFTSCVLRSEKSGRE